LFPIISESEISVVSGYKKYFLYFKKNQNKEPPVLIISETLKDWVVFMKGLAKNWGSCKGY
jgi:hypothetical protein